MKKIMLITSFIVLIILLSGCTHDSNKDNITGAISLNKILTKIGLSKSIMLTKEIKCTDSDTTGRNDFGLSLKEFKYVNINQQGSARGFDKNGRFIEITDTCTKNGKLNEVFCKLDGNIIDSKVFACPAEKTCRNGACETYISVEQPEFRTARVYTDESTTGTTEIDCSLPENIVAWYPLNGDSTDIVNENDGLTIGDVSFADGIYGEAASFLDGSARIEVNDPGESVLDLGNGFTIMAWINTAESNGRIITKDNNYRFILSGDRPQFYMFSEGGSQLSITPRWSEGVRYNVPNNDWEHIAGTISADNRTLKLYINGDLDNYITYSTSRPLDIGDFPLEIGGGVFNGLIDNIMIFNTELNEEQISEYMNIDCMGV